MGMRTMAESVRDAPVEGPSRPSRPPMTNSKREIRGFHQPDSSHLAKLPKKNPDSPRKDIMISTSIAPQPEPLQLPPDPDEMNEKRAAAAERALLSFAADFGEVGEGEDFTSQNLCDLLANFGHLCDRAGLDIGELLQKARGHYNEETDNEGMQFLGL